MTGAVLVGASRSEPPVQLAAKPPSRTTTTSAPATAPPAEGPSTVVQTTPPPVAESPPSPAPAALRGRNVIEQPWLPFAQVGGVVLHHPSAQVEMVGFHEASHDGAREMEVLPSAVSPITLESRQRGTGPHSAADIVSHPEIEVRAPVTGRVIRGGTYVLYCDQTDSYAVIEPDSHPGWEVKVLHVTGLRVSTGAHVIAGETVLASHPTALPFESQVDEISGQPAWPHVHIEVVDPSIPNRPTGPGC